MGEALGRLLAASLTLAATLPGPLELVHEHAGGDLPHVHASSEAGHRDHADHHHRSGRHTIDANQAADGPRFETVDTTHVHALNLFQRVAQNAPPIRTAASKLVERVAPTPPRRVHRFDLVCRSRGPPLPLG